MAMEATGSMEAIVAARLALQKELDALDHDLDDAIRSSPLWHHKEDLLRTVPGVGPTIARTLLAEPSELGTLSRREAASLASLAPFTRQSGNWRGKSFIAPTAKMKHPASASSAASASTLKGQLGLERHAARSLDGLYARVGVKRLALAAAIWHNWRIGARRKRSLIAYDH